MTLRHAQLNSRFLREQQEARQLHGVLARAQLEAEKLLPELGKELLERIPCQQLAMLQLLSGTLQTAYASEKLQLSLDTYEFVLQKRDAVRRPVRVRDLL